MIKFSDTLLWLTEKYHKRTSRKNYIFYRIVDYIADTDEFLLQCINTKATFSMSLCDLILDSEVLFGLEPGQACFIGLKYSQLQHSASIDASKLSHETIPLQSRYGLFIIENKLPNGALQILHKKTYERIVMDPRDIALSEEMINEFDASQAFYIGVLSDGNIEKPRSNPTRQFKNTHLRIIK